MSWDSKASRLPLSSSLFLLYIYINGRTEVCLSVCLLVRAGLMEIQIPAPIVLKFFTHIPTCTWKVLMQV